MREVEDPFGSLWSLAAAGEDDTMPVLSSAYWVPGVVLDETAGVSVKILKVEDTADGGCGGDDTSARPTRLVLLLVRRVDPSSGCEADMICNFVTAGVSLVPAGLVSGIVFMLLKLAPT